MTDAGTVVQRRGSSFASVAAAVLGGASKLQLDALLSRTTTWRCSSRSSQQQQQRRQSDDFLSRAVSHRRAARCASLCRSPRPFASRRCRPRTRLVCDFTDLCALCQPVQTCGRCTRLTGARRRLTDQPPSRPCRRASICMRPPDDEDVTRGVCGRPRRCSHPFAFVALHSDFQSDSMDSLTDRAAALQIDDPPAQPSSPVAPAAAASSSSSTSVSESAPVPAAAAFVLHVVDQSGAPSDAPIELVEGAASHIGPLCWDRADGSVTVAQVKQAIAEKVASRSSSAAGSDAAAASAPAAETAEAAAPPLPPLAVDHMRLVYLCQRVSLLSRACPVCRWQLYACKMGEVAQSSHSLWMLRRPLSQGAPASVPASQCRPLTDLGVESKTLFDYGVSSHSWLLLKRKFVRERSADEEEEEDDGGQYDEEEEEGYDEDAESQHDDNSTAATAE